MASISNAAHTAYRLIASFYALLWNCFTSTYGALKFVSGVYPPAKTFLLSTERAVELLKSNGSAPVDLKMKLVLEVFWGHRTSLETMGQVSVALPVSVVILGSTSMLLLVCCVVTAAFALAALLMLPLGWMCAVVYTGTCAGRSTYNSCTSALHSCNGKLRSARGGVVNAWRGRAKASGQAINLGVAPKPGADGHSPTPADKHNQVDESDSPKIATAPEKTSNSADAAVAG